MFKNCEFLLMVLLRKICLKYFLNVEKCVLEHTSMVRLLHIFHPVWTYRLVVQFTKAHPNELDISYNMQSKISLRT